MHGFGHLRRRFLSLCNLGSKDGNHNEDRKDNGAVADLLEEQVAQAFVDLESGNAELKAGSASSSVSAKK